MSNDDPYEAFGIGGAETIGVEPRTSRRGVVIGSAATVLAVAAGAAVWATTTLSGGGMQPDEVVPKTTFAYVKIDLDPAANQKLAARSFFSRFPDLKDEVSGETDDIFDNLLGEVISDESLDYRTDILPWFDKRVGVAAFKEGTETHIVAALRSKDDARAKTSLDKADVSYRLVHGYAIVGEPDGVAAAVQLAGKESLSDNATFRDDVERLDGDQIAVAWADVAQAFHAFTAEADVPLVPPAVAAQAKGRVIAGLHLSGDSAEVEGRFIDGDPTLFDVPAGQELLTGLPANTIGAVSVNGFGRTLGQATAGLPLDQFIAEYVGDLGLSVKNDVLPLLGNKTAIAVAPFQGLEDLQAGLVAKIEDPAKATAAAAKLQAAARAFGIPATSKVQGDTFVIAMPDGYATELAKGNGGLGAKPGFTKAMGNLDDVTQALYVDVTAAAKSFGWTDVPNGLSFGAVSGEENGEGFFRLRLVFS